MGRTYWRKALGRGVKGLVWRENSRREKKYDMNKGGGDILHALGAASPVTIVKVEAFAL